MKTSQEPVELFPYSSFPVRLEIPLENRIAWFNDDYHLQNYLTRVKLKPKDIKVLRQNEKPSGISNVIKDSLQQGTTKKDSGGTSRTGRNTKDLASSGTTSRTRKSKSKK